MMYDVINFSNMMNLIGWNSIGNLLDVLCV